MSGLGRCDAYTTRTLATARGGRRFIRCVQPATQEREHVVHGFTSYQTTVHLCPRHVGMFDRGQTGILSSRT